MTRETVTNDTYPMAPRLVVNPARQTLPVSRLLRRPAVRCKAHRRDGARCRRWAIHGGTVCPSHGGRARQVVAAARQRRAELLAEQFAARWLAANPAPDVDGCVWLELAVLAMSGGAR